MRKDVFWSKHYSADKDIDTALALDCMQAGRRALEREPNVFRSVKAYRRGELHVIYRETSEDVFVITAFWNVRKRREREWK